MSTVGQEAHIIIVLGKTKFCTHKLFFKTVCKNKTAVIGKVCIKIGNYL